MTRPLPPHHVELVEADAEQLYKESIGSPGMPPGPWEDQPSYVQDVFRRYAENPYRMADHRRRTGEGP